MSFAAETFSREELNKGENDQSHSPDKVTFRQVGRAVPPRGQDFALRHLYHPRSHATRSQRPVPGPSDLRGCFQPNPSQTETAFQSGGRQRTWKSCVVPVGGAAFAATDIGQIRNRRAPGQQTGRHDRRNGSRAAPARRRLPPHEFLVFPAQPADRTGNGKGRCENSRSGRFRAGWLEVGRSRLLCCHKLESLTHETTKSAAAD